MKCENFGFDLDGVLYDWFTALIPLFKSFGFDVSSPQEVYKILKKRDELFIKNIAAIPMPYTTMQPSKKTVEIANKISERFNIFYITYRPQSSYIAVINWLKKYRFPDYENLIMSVDKTVDIRINKIKYFVEDNPSIVEKIKGITNVIYKRNFYGTEIKNIFAEIKNLEELEEVLNVG